MPIRLPGLTSALVLLILAGAARAEEPLHQRIDALIAAGHPDYERHAAPIATDAEFLRRVFLDLNGTIPTADEVRNFLDDCSPDKRADLIDHLLGLPAYARRLAQHFDAVLMERRGGAKVPQAAWEEFLRTAFAQNRPYDQLVRDVLSADGADPKNRGPAKFYLDRNFEPTLVARDVGRLFLGRNLQCAQCHDHPIVDDYKQEQFYGLFAFLNRSYLFPSAEVATAVVAEKAEGEVTFVSVFDKAKAQHSTGPRLPGAAPVEEPKVEKGKEYKVAPAANVRPVPAVSRRELLAKAITDPKNRAFARTAVNRLWAMMLGRGLVQPLDLDHSDNPPSHPELLDLLTDQFAEHHFDVKWLLRELALTKTYQRSSEARDGPEDRYLSAALKPLAPEQLGYAVLQATGQADAERLALGKGLTDAALEAKLAPRVAPFRSVFSGRAGEPEGNDAATLGQALFLKYGGTVRGAIAARPGDLLDRLNKLKDNDAVADELFVSVLSRPPTADERKDVATALQGAANRSAELAEVIWALVASAEFRFNH
jgi:Protein of unknown function (DUF1549)/Protein of unknown function (DUF1553)